MFSLPLRTLYSLGGIIALSSVLSFVPRQADAQIQMNGGDMKEAFREMLKGQTPQRAKTNRNVVDALTAGKHYTTFLAIVDRAGMTPFLKGATTDSTKPEIAFVEDSVKSPIQFSSSNLQIQGEVPAGANVTQLKSDISDQIRDAMGDLMTEIIAQPGKITVFAPNDAAFAKLPKSTLDSLKTDSVAANAFVRAHTVNRGVYRDAFGKIRTMAPLSGTSLTVGAKAGNVATINGVAVTESDVAGDNGVAHGLEAVLDPKATPAPAPASTSK